MKVPKRDPKPYEPTKPPQVFGGPFDGAGVPSTWKTTSVCSYFGESGTRLAIYRQDKVGNYCFVKTIDESELETIGK